MTEAPAIELLEVAKALGRRPILRRVTLRVAYGEIAGIMGPNGSGKSLLLRIMSGLAYADAGTVKVGGRQLRDAWNGPLAEVGLLLETPGFLPYLTGKDNLTLLAQIRGDLSASDIAESLQAVGLDPADSRPVQTYSLGMRQRLGIAQALMEHPQIVLLDEPTNALDPDFIPALYHRLRMYADNGAAIVFTSHDRTAIEALADRVWLLKDGMLIPSDEAGDTPL